MQHFFQVSLCKTPSRFLCLLGVLVGLLVAPVLTAQAATTNLRVSKVYAGKAGIGKAKKTVRVSKRRVARKAVLVRETPSNGQIAGLRATPDELQLRSSVALVVDQQTNQVLYSKNDKAVLPIASLTKLMTGLLVDEAKLPMDAQIVITQDDVDTEKGSRSRLSVGSTLTRGELLHLALMSSENRAAHALGRTYPGGMSAFVSAMNSKARALGMKDTVYVEPTGLSSQNKSSAHDLAKLVDVASQYPLLRELTTSPSFAVALGRRSVQFNNTNRLVRNPAWDIGLQKTGYIAEAGRCLVMQTRIAGRNLIMVFLDSAGSLTRIADAQRVRRWLESAGNVAVRKEVALATESSAI